MTSQNITGTSGADQLIVTRGDTVEAGAGQDQITLNDPSGDWQGGEATLVFNKGFGSDVLDAAYPQDPRYVIRFGAGLSPDDLELVSRGYGHFSLQFKNGQGNIELPRQGGDPRAFVLTQLSRIEFADGTVWSNAQINDRLANALRPGVELDGSSTADVLSVRGYRDHVVYGGGGDDTLVGGGAVLRLLAATTTRFKARLATTPIALAKAGAMT